MQGYDAMISPNGVASSNLTDEVEVMMLGAGQEVGRSCCVIKYKGATVVCDTGYHPGLTGLTALPYVDELDWSTVDCILITHFHIDHAASLPYIIEKTNFKDGGGKVYMTGPTREVYQILMTDFVRMSLSAGGGPGASGKLYDEDELELSFKSIQAVSFLEEVIVPSRDSALSTTIPNPSSSSSASSIRFTSYPAGHILGAAMFLIEIAGARILYTGDYSTEEDRHLIPASVPNWGSPPDIMICESTYGTQTLEAREEKELRFLQLIRSILKRGGKALMPVFALGRAQELLLILDEFWTANPDMHTYPIYFISSVASKAMKVYRTNTSSLNANVQARAAAGDHPFEFQRGRFIKELRDHNPTRRIEDRGPCVVLTSPAFLQSGVSRTLLEKWAPDPRNGLVLTAYSVEGTLARDMQNEPTEFMGLEGRRIMRRCTIDYISFSAHVDYSQNSKFIDDVKPSHLVLVHGEAHNCQRLRAALKKTYAEKKEDMQIYTPSNTERLCIKLTRKRIARAISSLAHTFPTEGSDLRGILVAKDASYTLLSTSDLKEYTGLSTSTIRQRQRLMLSVGWDLVRYHLDSMYGSVQRGIDEAGTPTFRVMDVVDVKHRSTFEIAIEWIGSSSNDLIADSVLALLLSIDSSPASVKLTTRAHSHDNGKKAEGKVAKLKRFLAAHFGSDNVVEAMSTGIIKTEDGDVKLDVEAAPKPVLAISLDDHLAEVFMDDLSVESANEPLRKRVESVIELALNIVLPLSAHVKVDAPSSSDDALKVKDEDEMA